ncbi:MAG: hypothetical protein ACPG5B_06245 [Chitinophagales bacterium]
MTFLSCNNNKLPDVSNIEVSIDIQRFDEALFQTDSSHYAIHFDSLKKVYPDFYLLYLNELLSLRKHPIYTQEQLLLGFTQNPNIKGLRDSCLIKYKDISPLESDFEDAFRYYKYYFPNRTIPKIITHISEFGPATSSLDSTLIAISLDMYLGKNFPFYRSISLPSYIIERLETSFILPNAMKTYINGLYDKDRKNNNLIDEMVQEGKLLYFLDLVLPKTADNFKIGYSEKDLAWCEENEKMIWSFFIEQNLLFENKQREISKYTAEAPNTSGMPAESPGRVGSWVGWQIVKKFMQKNPTMSFDELMSKNGQQVLKGSKYKP